MTSIQILNLEGKVIKMKENKEHLHEFLMTFESTKNLEWLSHNMQKKILKFLISKGY